MEKEKMILVDGVEITLEQYEEMQKDKKIKLKKLSEGSFKKFIRLES
jgi:hypothetical protein